MSRKILSFLIILLIAQTSLFSQTYNWEWIKSASTNDNGCAYSATTDNYNNVYIVGEYDSPTITFDTITLVNNGSNESFMAKYNSSGDIIWARNIADAGSIGMLKIASDSNGNIFVIGGFAGTNVTFGTYIFSNSGPTYTKDIFIIKFDLNGNVIWANKADGSGDDWPESLSFDYDNNILLSGTFRSDTLSFGTTNLYKNGGTGGNNDIFIAKFDNSGNELWARNTDWISPSIISYWNNGRSIKADTLNNIYVTGYFKAFDNSYSSVIVYGTDTLPWYNYTTFQIIKFDKDGNVMWAKSAYQQSDWFTQGEGMDIDSDGNIYITGCFGRNLSDFIIFGNDTLHCNGQADIFVVKMNPTGDYIWAKSFGGNATDIGLDLIIDQNSNIYITGDFQSDSVQFNNTTLITYGYYNIFLVKLDTAGNILHAENYGSSVGNFNVGNRMTLDNQNNLFLSGCIGGDINFGPININLISDQNPFLGKLNQGNLSSHYIKKESDIVIYPNPTTETIHIKNLESEIYSYKVIDLTGKVVIEQDKCSENSIINLIGLDSGIYCINIQANEKTYVFRVIKQ